MVVFLIDKEADERPDGSGVLGGLGPLPLILLFPLFFVCHPGPIRGVFGIALLGLMFGRCLKMWFQSCIFARSALKAADLGLLGDG